MANFGKIILFRIEDLLPENNFNAFYPGINPPRDLPFIGAQINNDELDYTSRQDYRILGKNYKLVDGDLIEVIYEGFLNPSDDVFGDLYKPVIKNYFSDVDKLVTPESVIFYWSTDPEFKEQFENDLGLKDKVSFETSIGKYFQDGPKLSYGFANHNLSLSKPLMSNQETVALDQYGVGDNLKIKPVYNYYLKDYEQFYNSFSDRVNFNVNYYEEKSIPNFYYLITLLANPDVFSEVTSDSNAAVPFTMEGILEGIIPSSAGDTTTAPLGQKLANEIMVYEQEAPRERNAVVVVTPSFYKTFSSEISTQKKAHPFYNQIEIPITKGGTVFRDLFKKAKMYEQLQFRAGLQTRIINKAAIGDIFYGKNSLASDYNLFYTAAEEDNDGLKINYRSADGKTNFKIPYELNDNTAKVIEFDVSLNPEGINYDFKGDLLNPAAGQTYINFKDNYIPRKRLMPVANGKLNGSGVNFNLTKPNEVTDLITEKLIVPLTFYANNPESENNYIGSVIQNQINSILQFVFNKAKLNSSSVFKNLMNYSEVLFFEVQKLTDGPNSDPLKTQTFILPNDPDIGDKVEYIDSQIKHGESYIYKIYAHTISIGNKMLRDKLQAYSPFTDVFPDVYAQVAFEFINNLDIKLLRVPYHNTKEYGEIKSTVNTDNPPIPPQITFYPFKNVSDKIGFWFNIGLGEVKMKPEISLWPGILPYFGNIIAGAAIANIAQNQLNNGDITQEDYDSGKILYGTDDFGGKIKVYRITQLPETYADFTRAKIADIDVIGPRTLIDDIVPNQDYYYTFVHEDVHGACSNPTPVYHLKMITSNSTMEAGSVRLGVENLQPVLFNELIYLNDNSYEDQKVEKSFKKYLLVEPTLSQTYLSFDNFENENAENSFDTAYQIKLNQDKLIIGKGGEDFETVKGKKFKIRVTSKQTGRKIDLNVDFKNLSVIENYQE